MQHFGIALFEGKSHPFAKEPMEHDGFRLFGVFISAKLKQKCFPTVQRTRWTKKGEESCTRRLEEVGRKYKNAVWFIVNCGAKGKTGGRAGGSRG